MGRRPGLGGSILCPNMEIWGSTGIKSAFEGKDGKI